MQKNSILPDFKDGWLSFELPEELKDREIVIQIIIKDKPQAKESKESVLAAVREFAGIATTNPDENAWYLQ
ncbi:MAG: hypothetical protein IH598_06775 [Bacteroidales bacterium]|nr:hypothetical protein [Bacteroidales bacterium]